MYVTGNAGSTSLTSCRMLNIQKQINRQWAIYPRTNCNISKFAFSLYFISVITNRWTTP
jgi:hypothetical protein